MRYYYFNRSNGDLDTLSEQTVIDFKLTTLAKKRQFVGDSGATGFVLSEPIPHAKIENSSVIKDTEKEKNHFKKEAENLYNEISKKRIINGFDLSNTFEFDFQRRQNGSVILKKVGGGIEIKTKQQTDAIADALQTHLINIATAYQNDITAIENGDFSLANLKAF